MTVCTSRGFVKKAEYEVLENIIVDSRPNIVKMILSSISLGLHGVVVVGHQTWRFPTSGVLETRIVGVAEDTLDPRQEASRGHGLVREVA